MIALALFLMQLPTLLELNGIERNPHSTAADIAQGKKLFAGRCAGCHGLTGDGGKGANLAVPKLPRAPDDVELYRVIRLGILETEMPGSVMSSREIWQTAAYVRSLGRSAPAEGDVRHGEQVARAKGCLQCHALGGEGGLYGPAFGEIGARRSPAYIRAKIQDAQSDVPSAFRLAKATMRDGRNVSGIRVNEDTWSLQVRDPSGRVHSLLKENLSDLRLDARSPMPSYRGQLNPRELTDLVAFIANMRGAE